MRKPYKDTITDAVDALSAKQWSKSNPPPPARERDCRWARLEKLERYRRFANATKAKVAPTARDRSFPKYVAIGQPIFPVTEKGPVDVQ